MNKQKTIFVAGVLFILLLLSEPLVTELQLDFSFKHFIFSGVLALMIGIGIEVGPVIVNQIRKLAKTKGVPVPVSKPNKDDNLKANPEIYGTIDGGHNAIAVLINETTGIIKYYYAHSKLSLDTSINLKHVSKSGQKIKGLSNSTYKVTPELIDAYKELINHEASEDINFTVCGDANPKTLRFPMAIVNQNLDFEYISENNADPNYETTVYKNFQRFQEASNARHRIHCTEKKILNELYKEQSKDQYKDSKLIFFTEFEPCTTCLAVLSLEKKAGTFKEMYLYYHDLMLLLDEDKEFEGLSKSQKAGLTKFIKHISECEIKKNQEALQKYNDAI